MQVNYQQLQQLVAADQVQELGSTYQQYASPYVKGLYANNQSLQVATFNGKLMAIPDTQIDYQYNLLWVRKDWLDKLHLAPPKTLADLTKVARAFVKAKLGGPATVGLTGPSGTSTGVTPGGGATALTAPNAPNGFDTICGAFGAYPGQFYTSNGKVVYGSVQPQMKPALQALHNMYTEGLIDPQFAIRSQADELSLVESGKAGMLFGPWWIPGWPLITSFTNDANADWQAYPAPVDAKGKMNVMGQLPSGTFLVARKGYAHPEVAWKVESLDNDAIRQLDPVAAKIYQNLGVPWTAWPLSIQIDRSDAVLKDYHDAVNALKKCNSGKPNTTAAQDVAYVLAHCQSIDPAAEIGWYGNIDAYLKRKPEDRGLDVWPGYTDMMLGVAAMANNLRRIHEIYPLNVTPTPTMKSRMAELNKLEELTLVAIVVGQQPVRQFDSFVQEWHSLGGDQIL